MKHFPVKHVVVQSAAVMLGLTLAASAAAQQGFLSQPRAAKAAESHNVQPRQAGAQWQPTGRRPLLDALSSLGGPQRPSNGDWKSNWGQPAPAVESKSLFGRLQMPWSASAPERPSVTGTRRVYAGKTPPEMQTAEPPPQRGWLASLFGGEEEPQRPKTVNEFLGQKRPY